MKRFLSIALISGAALTAGAQEQFVLDPDAIKAVQDWVQENIDETALDALGVDRERAEQFFNELNKRLQGSSVEDLSDLGEVARTILPVLQQFEETRPYADWLQTHLDYFDASDKLRQKPSVPTQPPVPAPERGRTAWVTIVEKRPVPPAAEKYLPRLKTIFAEEKLPPQLVWVAEAESSFNPSARSPVGAAGLFQLMPQTAKGLDLSLWPRDERLQPEKNARAAAKYLRQLYGQFGDWRLALAAYNAGPSRVSELLKKHNARSYDAIAAKLPAETQLYVPKVEALLRKREGMAFSQLRPAAG